MSKDKNVPLSSFDVSVEQKTATEPAGKPRQGDETRPICAKHNCLMKAVGTRDKVTSYRCPVESCDASEKKVRSDSYVPREPRECPVRTCRNNHGQVFMEVAKSSSDPMHIRMKCPKCNYELKLPSAAAFSDSARRKANAERKARLSNSAVDELD